MKNKLIILFAILGLLIFSAPKVNADVIADPNDIFQVKSPGPNQKVKGTINIDWQMFDNDQSSIPYTIHLWDAGSCQTTDYGALNSNQNGISSSTQDNVIAWNTGTTLSNSNLADGKYCLQVCAALKQGTTDYSACNGRIVTIINHNRAPVITSTPTNLVIHESDSWQYQIKATDADNDPLTYSFIYTTPFLSINSKTGLVSTNGNSKALAPGVSRVDYRIVVSVDDGMAGPTSQEFTLSVIKDVPPPAPPSPTPTPQPSPSPVPVPTPTPTPTPTPQPNPGGVNTPSEITIISPTDTTVFTGKDNKIQWSASDADGIDSITLNYSQDQNNWSQITTVKSNVTSYNWDVSLLPDGDYYLQIVVKDMKGATVSKTSKKFQIKNQNTGNTSIPLIINVKPANGQEVNTKRPEISGSFVPSLDHKIDPKTFLLLLNDKDISSKCVVDETSFKCTPDFDLNEGLQKITVSVKDTSKLAANYDSTFTVKTVEAPAVITQSDTINILGREVPRSTLFLLICLCCICSILLIIPWLLYSLWLRSHEQETTVTTDTTPTSTDLSPYQDYVYTPTNYTAVPTPNVTTNYYTPPAEDTTTTTTYTQPVVDTSVYTYPTEVPEAAPLAQSVIEQPVQPVENYYNYTPTEPVQPTTEVIPQPIPEPSQTNPPIDPGTNYIYQEPQATDEGK